MLRIALRAFVRWFPTFLLYASIMIAAGALVGTVLYGTVGVWLVDGMPLADLLRKGAHDGAFLAGVWAPGTSIVLCFMRAHTLRTRKPQ